MSIFRFFSRQGKPESTAPAEGAPSAPAEAVAAPKGESDPVIRCRSCNAVLPAVPGGYGTCLVCGKKADDAYLNRERYFASGLKPITIRWDPAPDELLFVHAHTGYIPENSLLIVDPGQQAVYTSGGHMVVLQPGPYALFGEDRDVGEVARAIRSDTITASPISLKLNTRVVFFDSRLHALETAVTTDVSSSGWQVRLPLTVTLQVTDGATVLYNALNLADSTSASTALRRRAESIAIDVVDAALSAISADLIAPDSTPPQVRTVIRQALDGASDALLSTLNARLRDMGLTAVGLMFAHERASCYKTAT